MALKILYVEDEPFLGRIVKETLESRAYEVQWIDDGAKVLDSLHHFEPAICVLDVMLPNVDGFTLGTQLRKLRPRLPIIYLTAKTQTEDLSQGFASGGTDYLRKPFSVEELILRINNQLQLLKIAPSQAKTELAEEIIFGLFRFSPTRFELYFGEKTTKLSNREAQILQILAQNQNKVSDRRELLIHVWGDDSFFNSRTLDVYIRKLREYLSCDSGIEIITLKGLGYQFVVG